MDLSATWHVLVGDEERDGLNEGKLDVLFVRVEVDVGPREGGIDCNGFAEDVGIVETLGDAVVGRHEQGSHFGTSQCENLGRPSSSKIVDEV